MPAVRRDRGEGDGVPFESGARCRFSWLANHVVRAAVLGGWGVQAHARVPSHLVEGVTKEVVSELS